MLELERVRLDEVVRFLSRASRRSIVVGSGVDRVARCVTMSITTREPVTVRAAIGLVGVALEDSGIELSWRGEAIVLRVAHADRLPSCSEDADPQVRDREGNLGVEPQEPQPIETTPSPDAAAQDIRRISDTRFVLTRAALMGLFTQGQSLARLVPHREGGQVDGVAIYAIRPGSVIARLGFLNGDVIHSVGGHEINGPAGALEAYGAIQGADAMTIVITRRGRRVELQYQIVESFPQ